MVKYDLPIYNKQGLSVLSLDPGSVNMGIACSDYVEGQGIKLIANAVMSNPVKGLTKDLNGKRRNFILEIQRWIDKYEPTMLVVERFQARGLKGSTIEEVSIMLGCLIQKYKHLDIELITAATWKNAWARKNGLNLKENYNQFRVQPHQLDATLMGLYMLERRGCAVQYSFPNLIKGVEQASLIRLINRKNRNEK